MPVTSPNSRLLNSQIILRCTDHQTLNGPRDENYRLGSRFLVPRNFNSKASQRTRGTQSTRLPSQNVIDIMRESESIPASPKPDPPNP